MLHHQRVRLIDLGQSRRMVHTGAPDLDAFEPIRMARMQGKALYAPPEVGCCTIRAWAP
jgi:hypothetical protein